MCGIVGCAGNLQNSHSKMFRDMLLFDSRRGFDSTGVLLVPYSSNMDQVVIKNTGMMDGLGYMDMKEEFLDKSYVPKALGKVFLGHNRAATMGKIDQESAHPFEYGDVTGVHNGTLRIWNDLDEPDDSGLDSKALINTISKKGIEHTWKSFSGAAACVWWNKKDETLNFIRNGERPLYWAQNDAKNVLFWASEMWMITIAANLNKISLLRHKEGKNEGSVIFYEFNVNMHYEFKISASNFEEVKRTTLETRPIPQVHVHQGHKGYTNGYSGPKGTTTSTTGNKTHKRYQYLNRNWAEGFDKADKDTRDVLFTIEPTVSITGPYTSGKSDLKNKLEFLWCQQVNSDFRFKVFTTSVDNKNALIKHGQRGTIMKTIGRMRVAGQGKRKEYRISSECIRMTTEKAEKTPAKKFEPEKEKEPKLVMRKEEAATVYPIVKHGTTNLVDENTWEKTVDQMTGGCCSYCADPLLKEHSHKYEWNEVNQTILCDHCKSDPNVQNYLLGTLGAAYGIH